MCVMRSISVHLVSVNSTRSAAGGSSGDGSVDVKKLAEQNVQLKEALKRLHSHSIAEKTDVSALVGRLGAPWLQNVAPSISKRVPLELTALLVRSFHSNDRTPCHWNFT